MRREPPSKDEWQQWRESAITEAVLLRVRERIQAIQHTLGSQAGVDPLEDRKLVGMISAYNTLLEIDYEEMTPDE